MSWATENLRPASFRGIAFQVRAHEASLAGKSVVVHEFPNRNRPYIEELGRSASEFDFDAFLVGDDYMARRDQLLDAIAEEGPGELIHPWLGTLRVHARGARIREAAEDARSCRLALSFVEAGTPVSPGSAVDGASAVSNAGSLMLDASESALEETLLDVGHPDAAAAGAASSWERASKSLSKIDLSGLSSKAAAWRAKLDDITDGLLQQLGEPATFSTSVRDLFRSMESAVGNTRELIGVLVGFSKGELSRVFRDSDGTLGHKGPLHYAGADADRGDASLSLFLAHNGAAEAARLSVLFHWDTYDDALGAQQAIVSLLDALAELDDDAAFHRTQDLTATLVAGLPSPDANLPRLDTLTLQRTRPALVLAYQLYDSTDRETDIVARNRVKNPAFLPTNVPLQVLVDVT